MKTCWSRRDFLFRSGGGVSGLALAYLLEQDKLLAREAVNSPSCGATAAGFNPYAPKEPHFKPRATAVISLFMSGGVSHIDTFDPKPALTKYAGQPLDSQIGGDVIVRQGYPGPLMPSPFQFKKYGQSGIEISDIFPNVATCADELCVVRSLKAQVPNHEPSLMLMNCGDAQMARPSLGSWVTYGLGTENQNLPGFIAMCPGGYPIKETENWASGFLPGVFQGTYVDSQHTEIDRLIENIRNKNVSLQAQRQQLDLLRQLNAEHQAAQGRRTDSRLEARIQSFELAYRMQMEAADAFDITREPKHVREMYGEGVHARQTLIARRLLERGVRFVQLWHGASQPWDNHDKIKENHANLARQIDQPIGALLKDLKQRGMLDDTLVIWGGEFGRTPVVEMPTPGSNAGKINGRDHNHHGFTMWMAGGGAKGGTAYGATDDFGFKAVQDKVHVHDLHATVLHLMGFDHEKLTYRHAGRDFRLTDVSGRVVKEVVRG